MTVTNAFSTMGGSSEASQTMLEEDRPLAELEEVEEAFAYAAEALDAAERLEAASQDFKSVDDTTARLLNIAVESYIEKFGLSRLGLESNDLVLYDPSASVDNDGGTSPRSSNTSGEDDERPPEATRLKKLAKQLYAIVERVFKAIFDYFSNQKNWARKLIPLTKRYIGESDSLPERLAAQLRLKDRNLMMALHIDGSAPKKVPQLYEELATVFEKQHQYTAVSEVIRFVTATKEKDAGKIMREAEKLRDRLEEGLKVSLKPVGPGALPPVFKDKRSDKAAYYISKPMFGQNYITGIVGHQPGPSGSLRFSCGVHHDAAVPLRVQLFPVLTPEEIRQVCRIALRVCENVVRFSRDEELMKKALREASYLTSKETDQASVAALRNIAAVGQNSYIVHLRYVTSVTRSLMRYCAQSIARYEEVTQNG
jgi:hypothetical protein